MKTLSLLIAIAATFAASQSHASGGTLPKTFSITIKPGKIHEECVELKKDAQVAYRFTASQPVPFNIHYHLGDGPKDPVEYPVKIDKIDAKEDVFRVPQEQHYCWMWSNKTSEPVTLKGELALK